MGGRANPLHDAAVIVRVEAAQTCLATSAECGPTSVVLRAA